MPIHDWTRVSAGTFHDFHASWIVTLKAALNDGLLPRGYYAQAEQLAGEIVPDVLTLQASTGRMERLPAVPAGAVAVADAPPKVSVVLQADEVDEYARLQRSLVIRHSSGDDVIALVEIVSKGNKQTRVALHRFVDKAVSALFQGIHLLILDLHPRGRVDPQGIHGAIWQELHSQPPAAPSDKTLGLVAYEASRIPIAYFEPTCVGAALPDMPLFIQEGLYINAPLERTYMQAYATVPDRWRRVIEGRDPTP